MNISARRTTAPGWRAHASPSATATPPPVEQDARGIVDPAHLHRRRQLTRYPPGEVLDGLVDRFWAVRWALPPGSSTSSASSPIPARTCTPVTPSRHPAGGPAPWSPARGVLRPTMSRAPAGRPGLDRRGDHGSRRSGRLRQPPGSRADRPRHRRSAGRSSTSMRRADRPQGRRAGAEEEPGRRAAGRSRRRRGAADAARVAAAREVVAVARVAETDRSVRRVEDLAAAPGSPRGRCSACSPSTRACPRPGWSAATGSWMPRSRPGSRDRARRLGGPRGRPRLQRPAAPRARLQGHLGTTPAAYAARQAPSG